MHLKPPLSIFRKIVIIILKVIIRRFTFKTMLNNGILYTLTFRRSKSHDDEKTMVSIAQVPTFGFLEQARIL